MSGVDCVHIRAELDTIPTALDAFTTVWEAMERDRAGGGNGFLTHRARTVVSSAAIGGYAAARPRPRGPRPPASWYEVTQGQILAIGDTDVQVMVAAGLLTRVGNGTQWRRTGAAAAFHAWLADDVKPAAEPPDPRFVEWAAWLAQLPSVDDVFTRIHVACDRAGQWKLLDTSSKDGASLDVGDESVDVDDDTALGDLVEQGLLRQGSNRRGTPLYEVPGDARRFIAWRRKQAGPIDQTDQDVRRWISGADFAARHPAAARGLQRAFDLLHGGDLSGDEVVGSIGNLLRGALVDVAAAAGTGLGPTEDLPGRLKQLRAAAADARAAASLDALATFALTTLTLNQAVDHVRDEQDKGRARATYDDIADACTYTAVACYALDRHAQRLQRRSPNDGNN